MTFKRLSFAIITSLLVGELFSMSVQAGKGGGGKPPKDPTPVPEPTAVPCDDCPAMHLSVVNAVYFEEGSGLRQACNVEVRDAMGAQVDGADVTAVMTGDWEATLTETTADQGNSDFYAVFGPRDRNGRCGKKGLGSFTCTVTDVTHSDFTYVPASNTEDSETQSCQ